jgi:glutamine amidotransferase
VAAPLIAILDYGIGNLRSAQKALERVGADARLTTDHELIADAAGVMLPGVGSFGRCMEALRAAGLADEAVKAAASGRPFFGVCVGMQMLFSGSEESPGVSGLGVLPGSVELIKGDIKRPQMQWNRLDQVRPSSALDGLGDDAWVYFVHSYAVEATPDVVATCTYGEQISAAVERDNVWATQFHPEKSGRTGLSILKNFVDAASASRTGTNT